jgi:hypothetical protein
MFALALAIGMLTNACPMKIGIARDGVVYSYRMNGWYRTSNKTLADDLVGGCYNDANPSKVTSVHLEISPNAPKLRIDQTFLILERAGWPKGRIKVETWTNDPQEPH